MTDQHVRTIDLIALVSTAILVNLTVATALAGQLTALVLEQEWASWRELGPNLLRPLISVYTDPGDPMRAWPVPASGPRPTTAYWIFFAAASAALIDLSLAVGRIPRGERP